MHIERGNLFSDIILIFVKVFHSALVLAVFTCSYSFFVGGNSQYVRLTMRVRAMLFSTLWNGCYYWSGLITKVLGCYFPNFSS